MTDYGITSESASVNNLIAGEVKTMAVDIKASEGALAIGQVLAFDTSSNKFIKYVSGSTAPAYAVCAEEITIGAGGGRALAIVRGEVNKGALDATAQADPEIEGALLGSGIIPRAAQAA
jgi:hypothetical protein